MSSSYATERLFREFPWIWKICGGYSQRYQIQVKCLSAELAEGSHGYWMILSKNGEVIVHKIPLELYKLNWTFARRIKDEMRRFTGFQISYLVRSEENGVSFTIFRPPKDITIN